MAKKHLCIYNTISREIEISREIDDTVLVSSELKDWFDFHSKDESEPLLWEYERDRFALSVVGLGTANGYASYCGDVAFSWEVYDDSQKGQEVEE